MAATIRLGSKGPDVSEWQRLLTKAGFTVPTTGDFDEVTDQGTRAWQKVKGLTVDGVVGPASWGAMTGVAQACKSDPNAKFGRGVLTNVWAQVTGEQPSLAELQIAGAQARLESGYGKYQYVNKLTGEKSGVINNWGAVQAHGNQPGFVASDTHADGTPYTASYRIYATPEEGAADMLKEMTIRRPASWALMKAGDIDAWAVQMRAKDPISGAYGYFEQSAEGRATGIAKWVAEISCALNEPIGAQRGGPVPPGGIQPKPEPGPGAVAVAVGTGSGLLFLGALGLGTYRLLKGKWPWV